MRRSVIGLVALAAALAVPATAGAATASNLSPIDMGYGQTIYNYDFTETPGSWNHVDWAVSVLFYNNAEIDKVKRAFRSAYWLAGSRMYAYLNNGGGGLYDQDGGRKTGTPSCLGSTRHYREYAPPGSDRMGYNPAFGYYTVTTTHYDHHELCNDWYDDSEGTESSLYSRARDKGSERVRQFRELLQLRVAQRGQPPLAQQRVRNLHSGAVSQPRR